MPAKKRTDYTKRTSTSPTASTSHTSGDHHHRLRHTGPSISTQSSVGAAPAKPLAAHNHADPTPESTPVEDDPLEKKPVTAVSSGTHTPFTKVLYVLLFLFLLLFGWYIYGMVTVLERLKEEVGWWGILVGNSGEVTTCERCASGSGWSGKEGGRAQAGKGGELEGSMNALADELGISPKEVAYAVKPMIPQASLTSIASKSEYTDRSEAVRILFEDNL